MLDWHECEKSGHLVTHGNKGNYWILDLGLVYLELINATPSAPDRDWETFKSLLIFATAC